MEQARDIATLTAVGALEKAVAAEDAQAIVAACLAIRATAEPGDGAKRALVAVKVALAKMEQTAKGVDRRQVYLSTVALT